MLSFYFSNYKCARCYIYLYLYIILDPQLCSRNHVVYLKDLHLIFISEGKKSKNKRPWLTPRGDMTALQVNYLRHVCIITFSETYCKVQQKKQPMMALILHNWRIQILDLKTISAEILNPLSSSLFLKLICLYYLSRDGEKAFLQTHIYIHIYNKLSFSRSNVIASVIAALRPLLVRQGKQVTQQVMLLEGQSHHLSSQKHTKISELYHVLQLLVE